MKLSLLKSLSHSGALMLLATGCAAIQQPRVPQPAAAAAPIPLRVGICPGAEVSQPWLTRDRLFSEVALERERQPGTAAPDLVVTEASSKFSAELFAKPEAVSTRVTEVFSILSLGVLPTYIPHHGVAQVTFRRTSSGGSYCAPLEPNEAVFRVQARPVAREMIAFWVFVPAIVAALPRWYLTGGDEVGDPKIEPGDWLPAAIYAQRAALVRWARP